MKPWYKPQSKGIGGLLDRLAVRLGVYEDMPGPKYRSEGYRLEEVVGLASRRLVVIGLPFSDANSSFVL